MRNTDSTPSESGGMTSTYPIQQLALWQSRSREASGLEGLPVTRILRGIGVTARSITNLVSWETRSSGWRGR